MTVHLSIEDGEAYRLAVELSALTGEDLTEAVTKALAERVERENLKRRRRPLTPELIEQRRASVREIQAAAKALRIPDVTFGDDDLYDEHGLPK